MVIVVVVVVIAVVVVVVVVIVVDVVVVGIDVICGLSYLQNSEDTTSCTEMRSRI